MPKVEIALESPAAADVVCLFPVAPDTTLQKVRDIAFEGVGPVDLVRSRDGRIEAWRVALKAGETARVVQTFDADGPGLPDDAFAPGSSRFDAASAALAAQVDEEVPPGPAETRAPAIIQFVADRFVYGKDGPKYGDDAAEAPPLACGLTPGTCVDMHTAAVAALRAAGIEAAYVIGVHVPIGRESQRTGHCWINVRAPGVAPHWDISHHLQYGVRAITPAENPRPGRRFALSHARAPVFDGADGPVEVLPALNGFHALEGPERGTKLPTLGRFLG
jgi:transglutaminase-like putative cysteine protease